MFHSIHQNLQLSDTYNLHSVIPSQIDVTFPTNHFNDATGRNQSKQQLPVDNFSEAVKNKLTFSAYFNMTWQYNER